METKTKKGLKVDIAKHEEEVQATFFLKGTQIKIFGEWGCVDEKEGLVGTGIYNRNIIRVLLEIPRQDYDVIANEIQSEKEKKEKERMAEKEEYLQDKKKICFAQKEGEYYSGYTCYGIEKEILEELNIGHDLDSWGYTFVAKEIEKLGTEFFYSTAKKFYNENQEKIQLQLETKEKQKKELIQKAKDTREKQILEQWTEDCNNRHEECNCDIVMRIVMPIGEIRIERHCTF